MRERLGIVLPGSPLRTVWAVMGERRMILAPTGLVILSGSDLLDLGQGLELGGCLAFADALPL